MLSSPYPMKAYLQPATTHIVNLNKPRRVSGKQRKQRWHTGKGQGNGIDAGKCTHSPEATLLAGETAVATDAKPRSATVADTTDRVRTKRQGQALQAALLVLVRVRVWRLILPASVSRRSLALTTTHALQPQTTPSVRLWPFAFFFLQH